MGFSGGGTYNVTVVSNTINQNNGMLIVDTVAAGPLTLSGLQDIGGVTGADGVRVLIDGNMPDPKQNVIWVMHSGAWTHPDDMAAGSTVAKGALIQVDINGDSSYAGGVYVSTIAGVVGNNPFAWENEFFGLVQVAGTEESGAPALNTGSYLSLSIGGGTYTVALATLPS